MADLTEKQKRFSDYYIESGNATQSYIDAGYSVTKREVAEANARKLLGNYSVRKYIDERMKSKDNERIASQDEVLEFLTKVMRGEVTEKIPLLAGMGTQELVNNLPPVQVRKSAAELLGKRYMLWTDRQQIDANIGVQIVDDLK